MNNWPEERVVEDPVPAHESPAETSSAILRCRIRNAQGERVEGNLQIEVRHCGSGRTWRTFQYQRGVGQHVFHGLPPANYVVRIDAAGFRVLSVDTELIAGTNDLHISLDTADADRLILDADASRKPLAAEAEHLIRDPAARAAVITDGTGRFNLTTRLTVALLEDS